MSDPMRYKFTLAIRDEAQLHAELAALGLQGFLGVCGSEDTVETLFAVPLANGDLARLTGAVEMHTPDPKRAARAAAESAFVTGSDPASVATRAAFGVLIDLLNDLRQRLNQPRCTDAEIRAAILTAIRNGRGDPS